jgi:hypothetical protein
LIFEICVKFENKIILRLLNNKFQSNGTGSDNAWFLATITESNNGSLPLPQSRSENIPIDVSLYLRIAWFIIFSYEARSGQTLY